MLREFALKPFLVGLVAVAILVVVFGGILLLAGIFGSVVYWILAIVVFAWFVGFAYLATRG